MTAGLEHKAVEATTRVDSDLGEFAAIAATYDVDRVNDRIRFGAFENTIARWQQSGKRVPLHWDHRGEASNVIGSVDPATMQEKVGLGLYVEGKLDLDDSQVAREAWRSMRDDRVALSFGYLTVKSRERGEVTDLFELDLYEISIVPSPANPHTRILEMKSAAITERELRRRSDQIAPEHALGWEPPPKVTPEPAESVPTAAQQRRQWDRLRLELVTDDLDLEAIEAARDDPAVPTDTALREKAKALGLRVPPPRKGTRERFRDDMFNLLSSR
jgi:HK97 family phage prohead protease